jgi:hypothetical protein
MNMTTKFSVSGSGSVVPPPDDGAQFVVKCVGYQEAWRCQTSAEVLECIARLLEKNVKVDIRIRRLGESTQ